MKQLILIFGLLSLTVLNNSCKDDDPEFNDCWRAPNKTQLKLTLIEGPTITLPSKISMFFKVTDANDNPVGYLTEENFVIYEKGVNDSCPRIISEFEAKRKISGREQVFNHSTILVLDLSGSVLQQSLQQLKDAANAFVDQIVPPLPDPSISMGIYWFDGEDALHELEAITTSLVDLKAAINGITQASAMTTLPIFTEQSSKQITLRTVYLLLIKQQMSPLPPQSSSSLTAKTGQTATQNS